MNNLRCRNVNALLAYSFNINTDSFNYFLSLFTSTNVTISALLSITVTRPFTESGGDFANKFHMTGFYLTPWPCGSGNRHFG